MSKGKILPGLFATQNEDMHRMLKKPIASIYSMTNLVSFEPFVNSTIKCFFSKLDKRFVSTDTACDWSTWLQYFAFDVVGEITFSTRLGFLEAGKDVDGIMGDIWKWFQYTAVVGQMPWLDKIWVKNKFVSRLKPARYSPMVDFASKQQEKRLEKSGLENGSLNEKDFLARFIDCQQKDPSLPKWTLIAWTSSNVLAGSDTTAIYLRAVFKLLLTHPSSLSTLLQELDEAAADGNLSQPVTWKESRNLPYLDACIKEAGRLHPPFGLHLERVVPEGGLEICGEHVPPGTIVGMNAWVIHRDTSVFGADADIWRPERWLEADSNQKQRMENGLLTFGAGHRSCLGKNISLLEIYKLVPSILREYEVELLNPKDPWRVENRWFVPQFDLNVRLKKRKH
ncbi:MAG: hypothetical protein M1822_001235 [Bathelium mastoideum]|nr:MAG: hypothetical protein M1822_001235 [Bathelium mastoideum]